MLVDREGLSNFPNILIVGEMKIEDTNLLPLLKHKILSDKIHYLSVEDILIQSTFKKANISFARGIFFFSPLKIDINTENRT